MNRTVSGPRQPIIVGLGVCCSKRVPKECYGLLVLKKAPMIEYG